jgi:hypothetical protein
MSDESTESLADQIRALQQQQDESAMNEIAMIATLKELLPGFGPRFAQLRIGVETIMSPRTPQAVVELEARLKKARQ